MWRVRMREYWSVVSRGELFDYLLYEDIVWLLKEVGVLRLNRERRAILETDRNGMMGTERSAFGRRR